jgi:single-strand DNA-binding protein
MNVVHLIGRLGQDVDMRYTMSGQAVANVSLATNEVWNDKSGQRQERTEWHTLVIWGKLAEVVAQYAKKGDQLGIEGRLATRSWTGKDGQKHKRTEVIVSRVHFVGGKRDVSEQGEVNDAAGEDIPF